MALSRVVSEILNVENVATFRSGSEVTHGLSVCLTDRQTDRQTDTGRYSKAAHAALIADRK